MAKIFVKVLDEYGCTHLINCITADNASNNKRMGKRLEEMSYTEKRFEFVAKENLIPCFAHILNLVSREIIDSGVSKHLKEDLNVDDTVTELDIIEEETETSENENENEPESNSSDDDENNDKLNADTPIQKLRLGCKLIKRRNKLKTQFKEIRERLQLPKLNLRKDYPTRWNTCKNMVERFIILKDAYNHVVAGDEKLRKLCYINEEEFKYLVILNDYLEIFHATTLFLCSQR
jgi:hypothetical protein